MLRSIFPTGASLSTRAPCQVLRSCTPLPPADVRSAAAGVCAAPRARRAQGARAWWRRQCHAGIRRGLASGRDAAGAWARGANLIRSDGQSSATYMQTRPIGTVKAESWAGAVYRLESVPLPA
eukprot:scaffold401_cov399-Prasinococcus_capsulatus_cf.AAC.9